MEKNTVVAVNLRPKKLILFLDKYHLGYNIAQNDEMQFFQAILAL